MEHINLISPCNPLGYGTVGFNTLINLSKDYKVAYWPIGNIDYPATEEQRPIIQQALNNQADFDNTAPCLRIWHQFDMGQFVGKGLHVGYPIFELNKFNEREKHHLSQLDEIFVCSTWAQNVIADEIHRKSHVVPLGVDRSIFFSTPTTDSEDVPYVFLNVGKWEIRKGHDIILPAFLNAFNESDNVELWMMNHNPFLNVEQHKEWHNFYTNHKLKDKVKLLPRVQTQTELANIMRMAHCGVFPARAEGWNLEVLEMMSVGRQVITTDYSAHTEFCNNDNCKLIPINGTEDAWDGIWFHGQGGEWAKLDEKAIDTLSSLMLQSYHEGKSYYNHEGVKTANEFSWENSVKAIKKGLIL